MSDDATYAADSREAARLRAIRDASTNGAAQPADNDDETEPGARGALDLIVSRRMSEVTARPVDWLWPGRLPLGKLVVLDGDPGAGKSTLMVDLAARITTGSPLPDGHRLESAGTVLLLSAEDGAADTIRPRLDAAGADPSRVVLFDGLRSAAEAAEDTTIRAPSLPFDLPWLRELVAREAATLVIVDVLNAFLSAKVDGHRDQDVRGALAPLAKLAEETGCCVVVIRHLNKSGGANPLYRGGGSIGIMGAARAALLAAGDPDDPNRRVLAVSKCNLAPIPPSLAYRLMSAPEHGCARVQWDGPTSHSAADLLTIRAEPGDDQDDAASVLATILTDGPVKVQDANAAMAEAGFTKDQARRAKERLKVTSEKYGKPGDPEQGWKWSLPTVVTDDPKAAEDGEDGTLSNPAAFAAFVPPSQDGNHTP